MLESENMTGVALVLISFNFFSNNLLDEDLENIMTGLESLEKLLLKQLCIITNTYIFFIAFVFKNKVTFEKLLKLRGGKMNLRGGEMPPLKHPKKNPVV